MARQQPDETPADFVRRMGWGVGTVIWHGDAVVRITATGEDLVLGRFLFGRRNEEQSGEVSWNPCDQEWEVWP